MRTPSRLRQGSSVPRLCWAIAAAGLVAASSVGGCSTTSCDDLRSEARELVAEHSACAAGDTCVVLAGYDRDCTGVLGCPRAVNAKSEAKARERAAEIAGDSRDCTSCAMAECAMPGTPACDE